MAKEDSSQRSSGKGKAFFERGDQVASTGNWDFAIEMYLEGIARELDNIEQGHQPLRDVSLKRKAQGGKGPGMIEKMKRSRGKTPEEKLINAEYLLAKEPGAVQHMVQLHDAAKDLGLTETLRWICGVMLDAQRVDEKPNLRVLKLITQSYNDLEEYVLAIRACEMAINLDPNDAALHNALKELAAKHTIQAGKYDQEGEFTKSVKDLDKQEELLQKDAMVKQEEYLKTEAERAVKAYEAEPTEPGKITAAAKALTAIEDEAYENQAIDILAKAHRDTGAYQFKMQIGDIKMRQEARRYRALTAGGDKEGAAQQLQKLLAFELDEYTERAENYPTNLAIKYELGRRQFLAGNYDDAVGSFQQAQRDPKRHLQALNYLGQTFAKKGWLREAADTYKKALDGDLTEARAKDIRYSYGDVLEKMGDLTAAQDEFSEVAQIDFNYKDVRERLESVRQQLDAQGG